MKLLTHDIKAAFDCIRAEDSLKANTVSFLQAEALRRNQQRGRTARYAAALASVAVMFLLGMFSYNLYFAPIAYVDVDVNPSVELMLNRFDRVVGTRAYNEDGENILTGLYLNNKNYNDALIILIEAIGQKGYIQNDGLVSVTLQTDNASKENQLLASLQNGVAGYMAGRHHSAQVDVFSVSGDTRTYAHRLNLSPAKYLAIQQLIEVDPAATVESCRGHSISEIKQLTQNHTGEHHSVKNGTAYNAGDYISDESGRQGSSNTVGHHGNGHH